MQTGNPSQSRQAPQDDQVGYSNRHINSLAEGARCVGI